MFVTVLIVQSILAAAAIGQSVEVLSAVDACSFARRLAFIQVTLSTWFRHHCRRLLGFRDGITFGSETVLCPCLICEKRSFKEGRQRIVESEYSGLLRTQKGLCIGS